MASKKPSLLEIISETTRIVTTHPRHFLTIAALFLFPISILTTLLHPTSLPSHYNQFLPTPPHSQNTQITPPPKSHLPTHLLYSLLVIFLDTCAISSIIHTTINAQHYHSVQLVNSLKSTLVSFLPILGTKLVLGLIFFAFGTSIGIISLVVFLSKVDYTSTYFILFFLISLVLIAALIVYAGIQWSLMYAVTVYESTWGFAALKRSSYLVKGMRRVAYLMIMSFGIPSVFMSMLYMNLMAKYVGRSTGWIVALTTVVYAGFVTILSLFNFVAQAVLFVYCKELHGETVSLIGEKLGGEYAKVPVEMV